MLDEAECHYSLCLNDAAAKAFRRQLADLKAYVDDMTIMCGSSAQTVKPSP